MKDDKMEETIRKNRVLFQWYERELEAAKIGDNPENMKDYIKKYKKELVYVIWLIETNKDVYKNQGEKNDEACGNCGRRYGEHKANADNRYPAHYCPGDDYRIGRPIDWEKSPGTCFITTGKFRKFT